MKASSAMALVSTVMIVAGVVTLILPLASVAEVSIEAPRSYYLSGCCSILIPVKISNNGPLALRAINLSVTGHIHQSTVNGYGFATSIPPGHTSLLNISIPLPLDPSLLTENSMLNVTALLSAEVSSLLGLYARANFSLPWQAPIQNFDVGEPSLILSSYPSIDIPYSFLDASPYIPIDGELILNLTSDGELIGSGSSFLNASPGSHFDGNMLVNLTEISLKGLLTNSTDMNYAIFYSLNGKSIELYSSSYHWGAPLNGISVGNISYSLKGSSIDAQVPVHFEDLSSLSLNTEMYASLLIAGNYYNSTQVEYKVIPGNNVIIFGITFPASNSKPSALLLNVEVQGVQISYMFPLGG